MISDTLSDAAHEIRRYMHQMPEIYGAQPYHAAIVRALAAMEDARIMLDTPPGFEIAASQLSKEGAALLTQYPCIEKATNTGSEDRG